MKANVPAALLRDERVIVVCGAGGVGKTTTSASLALAAARAGRRVLVITIDPSKRLAQTLGVSAHASEPTRLPPERLRAVGVAEPGSLSAWMLDPQSVSDQIVRRLSPNAVAAERLLNNRVYRHVTSMIVGMQEYMAVEALHEFVQDERYDLVVLDTPPSRDALRFLDAPSRATSFLDSRVLGLFLPDNESLLRRAASTVIEGFLDLAFGQRARREIQQFFELFEGVLTYLGRSQGKMREFFDGPGIAFVLVSSPAPEAIAEARYFEEKTRTLSLPLAGFVLNRSCEGTIDRPMPSEVVLPADAPDSTRRALEKLEPFARAEAESAARHRALRETLAEGTPGAFALALPDLPGAASDLESLVVFAEVFEAARDSGEV